MPLYLVRVQEEFVGPGEGVVKNRHLAVPHDHHFLFLDRMQPGHENMRVQTRGKFEMSRGNIGNLLMQIIGPRGEYGFRPFSGKGKNHGDIVGSERPQGVFLATDLPQVESM